MAGVKGQPAPKPGSLPSTPADANASAAQTSPKNIDMFAPPTADETAMFAAPTPEELGVQVQAPQVPPSKTDQALEVGGQVLEGAARALDYPGGHVRTALATAAGLATGQPNVVTDADVIDTLKGKAPNSAEYLRRLGVPEGGSVNIPGLGRVTVRGAKGLALDIATDPLTAISKMIRTAPYIGKLLGAPGRASEALGQAVYKRGLSKVDAKLAAKGESAVSDLLLQEGKSGTTAKLAKDVDELSNTMGEIRQGLYDKANELGVNVSLQDAKFAKSRAVLEKMRRNPNLAASADELEQMITNFQKQGVAPIDVVSEWKTDLYSTLPQSAFEGPGRLKGKAKQFKAALAGDLREMIVETGNKADKGLGDAINSTNEKWGILLNAKKPMAQQAKQASGKGLADWIDATIIGGGLAYSPMGSLGAVAAKKTAQGLNTTYVKTKVGKAMVDAGRKGVVDTAARQAIIKMRQTQGEPPAE